MGSPTSRLRDAIVALAERKGPSRRLADEAIDAMLDCFQPRPGIVFVRNDPPSDDENRVYPPQEGLRAIEAGPHVHKAWSFGVKSAEVPEHCITLVGGTGTQRGTWRWVCTCQPGRRSQQGHEDVVLQQALNHCRGVDYVLVRLTDA